MMKICKADRILTKIQDHLGGDLRRSARNVPYLLIGDVSFCYFAKKRTVKIFEDFGQFRSPQKSHEFKDFNEAVRFYKENF